jgi:hypothetical protein
MTDDVRQWTGTALNELHRGATGWTVVQAAAEQQDRAAREPETLRSVRNAVRLGCEYQDDSELDHDHNGLSNQLGCGHQVDLRTEGYFFYPVRDDQGDPRVEDMICPDCATKGIETEKYRLDSVRSVARMTDRTLESAIELIDSAEANLFS